jgi:hypothetical protein
MTDDDLITLVREQRGNVHMDIPMERIAARGRALRARRRMPGLAAGVLAVVGAAALAVTALLPAGHQAGRQPPAQLAAWTVTRQADGNVDVTIRQLSDPAGLAAALHGAGVPAYVAFAGPVPARCAQYPVSQSQQQAIYQFQPGDGSVALVIDPSAIPGGAGLFFLDVPASALNGTPPFPVVDGRSVHIGVVQGSSTCPLN